MEIANTNKFEKTTRAYIGGGTFSANPVSMVAGASTLSYLRKNPQVYEHVDKLGDAVRKGLDRVFDGKVITTGKGSLFMTHFVKDKVDSIQNASDAAACDTELLHRYHFEMMADNGIFFLPGKLGAFSKAHTKSDVKNMINASEEFAKRI